MIHVPGMVSEERKRNRGEERWFCSGLGMARLATSSREEGDLGPTGKLGEMSEYFTL